MAFSDLEKRKDKNFLEKHYAGARANIEQRLYGAFLNDGKIFFFICDVTGECFFRTILVLPRAWFFQYLSDRMITEIHSEKVKINEWQPYNYSQRKTFYLLKQYPCCLIGGTRSKKVKEKLNLSLINANKYSFLSKRNEEDCCIRWVFFFCVCVIVDRDKVEVHKKTPKRLIFSLLDWTCLVNKGFAVWQK